MIVMVISVFFIFNSLNVSALEFSFDSPASVEEEEEFEVSIGASTEDIYDVKIFVYDGEFSNIVSEINPNNGEVINTIEPGCVGTNGNGPFSYVIDDRIEGNFNANYFTAAPIKGLGGPLTGDTLHYTVTGGIVLSLPVTGGKELQVFDEEGMLIAESRLDDVGARPCLIE